MRAALGCWGKRNYKTGRPVMFKWLNEQVKKVTVFDISCVKLSVFFASIIVVKFFPQLLNINYLLLIILMLACAAKPVYTIWMKKQ